MKLLYHWRWLLALASIAFAVGCGVPLLPPEPDVPPIVEPQPKPGVAWILVIEESAERTPVIAAVLGDSWWQSSGVKFRIYDKDTPEAKDIAKAASGIKLPAIVLTDVNGKVLHRGELPTSIEDIKRLAVK